MKNILISESKLHMETLTSHLNRNEVRNGWQIRKLAWPFAVYGLGLGDTHNKWNQIWIKKYQITKYDGADNDGIHNNNANDDHRRHCRLSK